MQGILSSWSTYVCDKYIPYIWSSIYSDYFTERQPARAAFQVSAILGLILGLIYHLILVSILGLILGLIHDLILVSIHGLILGLIYGLILSLIQSLIHSLVHGLSLIQFLVTSIV